MKRYLLFYGEDFYPMGGWTDAHIELDDIPTLDDVKKLVPDDYSRQWAHVADTTADMIVIYWSRDEEWQR